MYICIQLLKSYLHSKCRHESAGTTTTFQVFRKPGPDDAAEALSLCHASGSFHRVLMKAGTCQALQPNSFLVAGAFHSALNVHASRGALGCHGEPASRAQYSFIKGVPSELLCKAETTVGATIQSKGHS